MFIAKTDDFIEGTLQNQVTLSSGGHMSTIKYTMVDDNGKEYETINDSPTYYFKQLPKDGTKSGGRRKRRSRRSRRSRRY